jgi:hypothetical protein
MQCKYIVKLVFLTFAIACHARAGGYPLDCKWIPAFAGMTDKSLDCFVNTVISRTKFIKIKRLLAFLIFADEGTRIPVPSFAIKPASPVIYSSSSLK